MKENGKLFCDDCKKEIRVIEEDDEDYEAGGWTDYKTAHAHICEECYGRWFDEEPPPCKTECRTEPCKRGGDCWHTPTAFLLQPYETYYAPRIEAKS